MFDPHFHHRDDMNQFHQNVDTQLSSLNDRIDNDDDDDDGMVLGDEAGAGILGNMSDEEGNLSPNLNVSPTIDDDDDDDGAPELVDQKPLQTPPLTPTTRQTLNSNIIDQRIAYPMNNIYHQNDDSYSNTTNNSPSKQNTVRRKENFLFNLINLFLYDIRDLQIIHMKLMIMHHQ